jgi:hypothetical protein
MGINGVQLGEEWNDIKKKDKNRNLYKTTLIISSDKSHQLNKPKSPI